MRVNPYRVPLTGAYNHLVFRLEGKEVSIRKQMCLAYLRWRYTAKHCDKEAMVELAKQFRKEEGRVGRLHRTVLEKRIRKYFREVKKHQGLGASRAAAREYAKGQRDRGEGIHSPEELERKKERWAIVRRRQTETNNEPCAKVWVVTDPEGNEFRVKGLKRWQRDNGFGDTGNLIATATRPWDVPTYRGYRVRHYDETKDSHVPWNEGYKPKDWNDPDRDDLKEEG